MGLKASSFWVSWLITGLVLSLLATSVQMLMGHICQFEVFLNTPFWYHLRITVGCTSDFSCSSPWP